ncbi:MAG: T9SS type A sorting domain-containing protein [Flavobacteriaceae bacterium]|nr:T9SS type A sorting domain-containing protein [Flavobacteriaceae bacterium]
MTKILHIFKGIKLSFLLLIFFLLVQNTFSQDLYIGASSEFYLKSNTDFTTSNTVVTVNTSGKFSVEAGSDWGFAQEYVDGEVTAYGNGETKLPVGNNGVYAPVFANHTGNIVGSYFNATPTNGSNGAGVDAVSNVEYWKLTGNAIITLPWNNASGITSLVNDNGGALNSIAIVGNDNGTWNLVSAVGTNIVSGDLLTGNTTSDASNEVALNGFSQFTFGIDHQILLTVNDLFLFNGISILSNPIKSGKNNIQFRSENNLNNLEISLYDLRGRQLRLYQNVSIQNGIGTLQKPNLPSGVYLLKFSHEGKQGVKKIIIE